LIQQGTIDTKPWMTHDADFEEVPKVFDAWLAPESGVIKAIIRVNQ